MRTSIIGHIWKADLVLKTLTPSELNERAISVFSGNNPCRFKS